MKEPSDITVTVDATEKDAIKGIRYTADLYVFAIQNTLREYRTTHERAQPRYCTEDEMEK